MFDPALHYIDSKGFARHKDTGHLLGIEEQPPKRHPNEGAAFPKWVTPHPNHITRQGDRMSAPHFHPDHFHVDRTDNVTVQVRDADEEAFALADPHDPQAPPRPR